MKRYLRVYLVFIRMSIMTMTAYRMNFINAMISTLLWGIFLFISMYLLTSQSGSAYGWKQIELMLVVSGYSVLIGIFHTMFSVNFERMSRTIRYGGLDMILAKPLDAQFTLTFGMVNPTSSLRIVIGFLSGVYFLYLGNISVSLFSLLVSLMLMIMGITILYSTWFIIMTLLIWFPRASSVAQLMYSITGFARFPKNMYSQFGGGVYLFFLPLTLVLFPAVRQLLSRPDSWEIGLVIGMTLFIFITSRVFWLFSLRFYASASS